MKIYLWQDWHPKNSIQLDPQVLSYANQRTYKELVVPQRDSTRPKELVRNTPAHPGQLQEE